MALLVLLGGMAGTAARLGVAALAGSDLPWGTLAVNLAGSLLLGYLIGRGPSPAMQAFVGVGVAGGLTTFSTLMLEVADLGWWGVAYLLGSVAGGVALVRIGWILGRGAAT